MKYVEYEKHVLVSLSALCRYRLQNKTRPMIYCSFDSNFPLVKYDIYKNPGFYCINITYTVDVRLYWMLSISL